MTDTDSSLATPIAPDSLVLAEGPFRDLASLVAAHARQNPDAAALICGEQLCSYRQLDAQADQVASRLQQLGLGPGDVVALCADSSVPCVVVFLGALRAGLAVAPLAPSATGPQLAAMASDARARCVFVDAAQLARDVSWPAAAVLLQDSSLSDRPLTDWCSGAPAQPKPVAIQPEWPFNLIYSSGTTGTPKGIVQPHGMRWAHIRRAAVSGYAADTVSLIATPLYSNTTLVCVFPTLAYGGCVVLMPRFDALRYLQLAQLHRATHTMLVPVQYQRLMAHPDFDQFDLLSFQVKLCTSAPFHAELKAQVLRRWPGALVEYYGLTEGGGTCILQAHLHPEKLHTVGQPALGHDIRLIDEDGQQLPVLAGQASASGEVVGRSGGMMSGYHGQPELTAAAEWFDEQGQRFIRTGDIGHFDADGFLLLHDRRKDMIISGGFNIYPSDLEAVLRLHPAVADVAVVGVPSAEWGETPVAFVVAQTQTQTQTQAEASADATELGPSLQRWANEQLGKTQRLRALVLVAELPRSAIGKVLKRELRQRWMASPAAAA